MVELFTIYSKNLKINLLISYDLLVVMIMTILIDNYAFLWFLLANYQLKLYAKGSFDLARSLGMRDGEKPLLRRDLQIETSF